MFSSSEGFLKRSSIPSVPVNYSNKQQKTGKSFIPRFMTKQATIDHHGLKKDSARTRDARTKASISYPSTIYSEPLEFGSSPKSTKKVEEKPRQKGISLSRKSSTISIGKTSTLIPSTKKDNTKTRTSHRNCTSCASSTLNRVNSIKNTVNNVKNTVKRKSSRVLRCKDDQDTGNVIKDDDASSCSSTSTSKKSHVPVRKLSQNFFNKKRVSPLQPSTTLTKSDDLPPPPTYDSPKEKNDLVLVSSPTLTKNDDLPPPPTFDSPKEKNDLVLVCSPTLTKSDDLSPSHKESDDLECSPTSTKCDDLLPTFDLHKETNDLVLVCTPTLIKSDDSLSIPNLHKETNDLVLVCSSLKIKQISFQRSVNNPEASISITHSNLEVSTTTSIINPELVPISLYYKKENEIKNQFVMNNEESDSKVAPPTMVNNVCKKIVRFSKFISKIKSLV